jgi:hypothetical protein
MLYISIRIGKIASQECRRLLDPQVVEHAARYWGAM